MLKEIDYTLYRPKNDIKGIVVIMHGMQEHQGRYFEFASFLQEHGFLVCTYDHLGHGKKSEKHGFFAKENGFDKLVENGNILIEFLKSENKDIPLYLIGHSMGSIVARCYLNKYSKNIDKLVLIGTPFPNPTAKVGKVLTKILMKKNGIFAHSAFLDKIVFLDADKKYPNLSWLAEDSAVVKSYKDDELCGIAFTLNGYYDLFDGLSSMVNVKGIKYNSYDLPIKFFVGEDDPIVGGEKGLKKSKSILLKVGFNNVTSKAYPNMRHEILNEKNKLEVFNDILNFLK